jgi:hypothetical protein
MEGQQLSPSLASGMFGELSHQPEDKSPPDEGVKAGEVNIVDYKPVSEMWSYTMWKLTKRRGRSAPAERGSTKSDDVTERELKGL